MSLFADSGVQHIYCVVFLFCFSLSCVPCVASFSGLSFFDCPFGILQRLFYLLYVLYVYMVFCTNGET